MADDYYGVLGVARDATSQEIKRAFRDIARRCHPDVAGADPAAEEQFKSARKAYETLMDPIARARYDRRGQRKAPAGGGSFFDAFYKATERAPSTPGGAGARPGATGRRNPGNSVTLEDLFNDFGDFGFGQGHGPARREEAGPSAAQPLAGDDVYVDLEVPPQVAREGGSLTAVYYRMQRADSWRPGTHDAGLVRVQDIADIRIVPGTREGEVLRERGLGSAGAHGGPYGDLVVTVRVVGQPAPPPPRPPPPEEPAPAEAASPTDGTVDLTIVEALLGGRVWLDTPQGRVRLTIPPGTSSGVRLRLRGRGPLVDGAPSDWFAVTRILVPRALDDESRRLIEEYARLNPSADEG